jgi:hypothetical protein
MNLCRGNVSTISACADPVLDHLTGWSALAESCQYTQVPHNRTKLHSNVQSFAELSNSPLTSGRLWASVRRSSQGRPWPGGCKSPLQENLYSLFGKGSRTCHINRVQPLSYLRTEGCECPGKGFTTYIELFIQPQFMCAYI